MNSKNYRDLVLEYIEKLGEINRLEDQLLELKKKASDLKQEIDNSKRKK